MSILIDFISTLFSALKDSISGFLDFFTFLISLPDIFISFYASLPSFYIVGFNVLLAVIIVSIILKTKSYIS